MTRYFLLFFALGAFALQSLAAQTVSYERPFIWVRASERDAILERIETHRWAKSQYETLKREADAAVASHKANRSAFVRRLPLVTTTGTITFDRNISLYGPTDDGLLERLDDGINCASMYYLTGDEDYARCAADLFHNIIESLTNTPQFSGVTGGWMLFNGLLGETQRTAHQLPVMYDLLHPFLKQNPTVFQLQTTGGAEVVYDATRFADAQFVFRKYHELITTRGYANNNWSPNMAQTLVPCVLALEDPAEREEKLKDYLTRDNRRQTSLKTDARHYQKPGDVWPESMHYSNEVNNLHPVLMIMLDRYDPSLNLYETYPYIPASVARPFQLSFPNGTRLGFGDGNEEFLNSPYGIYELIYGHAKAKGMTELTDLYGPLINAGVQQGRHSRGAGGNHARRLFWAAAEVDESAEAALSPRTDTLAHAGAVLQRNLSPTGAVENDLMCYVAGAAYVHSHADGMNIELFGNGYVLGADSGKDVYKTDRHEDYYRVFAGHNTIIVNGASRGQGGWQNVGINTVQVVGMEPEAAQPAISPNISFTCTSFEDDKGDRAEATQQRTLALIRTSPTTGYYVDIFRSDSALPSEYHDYLYHNIGELLEINQLNGEPLPLAAEPERFKSDIGDGYNQPGWRYFDEVYNGTTDDSVKAQFTTAALPGGTSYMDVFIPGDSDREYARVMAPPIRRHAREYDRVPCPTLVVRKTGEAWNRPFALVFEPHKGSKSSGSVVSVERLIDAGVVRGLKVVSLVHGETITQYVLSNPEVGDTYENEDVGFRFTGRFAVITDKGDGRGSLYMGEGTALSYGEHSLTATGAPVGARKAFFADRLPVYAANGDIAESSQLLGLSFGNGGKPGSGEPWPIFGPAVRLQAENFDQGPGGEAYSDADAVNTGGQYRPDSGVDIEAIADASGGIAVVSTEAGEWLNISVDVAYRGNYDLTLRVARGAAGSSTLRLSSTSSDGVLDVELPSTGSDLVFETLVTPLFLDEGSQTIRIQFVDGGVSLDWLEFTGKVEMVALGSPIPQSDSTAWSDGNPAHPGAHYTVPAGGDLLSDLGASTFPGESLSVLAGGKFQVRSVEALSEATEVADLIVRGGDSFASGSFAAIAAGEGSMTTNVLKGRVTHSGYSRILTFGDSEGAPRDRSLKVLARIDGTGRIQAWEGEAGRGGAAVSVHNVENTFSGDWEVGAGSSLIFTNSRAIADAAVSVLAGGTLEVQGSWLSDKTFRVADAAGTRVELGIYSWSVDGLVFGDLRVPDGTYAVADLNELGSNAVFFGSGAITVGTLPSGAPVAHWKLDEGTGTEANDFSGRGYSGALLHGARWESDSTRASYVAFDGQDDRIATDFEYAISSGEDFTWAWWAKLTQSNSGGAVMVGNRYPQGAPGAKFEFIKLTPTSGQFANTDESRDIERYGYDNLSVNGWHHYAMVKTGTQYQWYVNGQAQGSPVDINYDAGSAIPFNIGGDDDDAVAGGRSGEHFAGGIDDVVLYARALDAAGIAQLMSGVYYTDEATRLEGWRLAYFGSDDNSGTAADDYDADSDGESNLIEFATGQDPFAGTRVSTLIKLESNEVYFYYTRSVEAMSDGIRFEPEWSTLLAPDSWSSTGMSEAMVSEEDGMQRMKVSMPPASSGPRFVRILIRP